MTAVENSSKAEQADKGEHAEHAEIVARARQLGFADVGITPARLGARAQARLLEFVAEKQHGTMDWFSRRLEERLDPQALWSAARTAIVMAVEYTPPSNPREQMARELADKSGVIVAHYARGLDYHDIIKKRLKLFARWLCTRFDTEAKVFVDTAALSEKALALNSGIGWQGKNTQLVSRRHGCWLFLGVVLSSRVFAVNLAVADSCGSCSRCIDACPTGAFPRPYALDARKCISYLTIEHRGVIPRSLRVAIGNRVFGCDDCLTVCPWNKFARTAQEMAQDGGKVALKATLKARDSSPESEGGNGNGSDSDVVPMSAHFSPREAVCSARIGDWLRLDEDRFRQLFRGTAIKRLKLAGLRRNLLIAAGNSGDATLLALVEEALDDGDEVVRASAVWAYWRLAERDAFCARADKCLSDKYSSYEASEVVRDEWLAGLNSQP